MYKDLSKEEKKRVAIKYVATKRGKDLSKTLDRLVLEGLFLVFCFAAIVGALLFTNVSGWFYWVVAIITIIFAVIFLVGQFIIRRKEHRTYFEQLSKTEKNRLTKNK